jgi:hypothetical protein
MIKSHLTLVAPTTENRTVTPLRRPNAELRTREHLTADEVEALMTAARGNRYGHRNSTMILLAYRHGLRARELFDHRASEADGKRESGDGCLEGAVHPHGPFHVEPQIRGVACLRPDQHAQSRWLANPRHIAHRSAN